jgi:3-phenylpropionate/trans-cinnamate dioxygenase ferredoxin subunit
MAEFVPITTVSELPSGQGRSFFINKESIAIFHVGDEFFAIEDFCTHAGAPLGDGFIEGHTVACSWHGAQFCLKTGHALTPPAFTGVRTYEVRVEGEQVLVALPETPKDDK